MNNRRSASVIAACATRPAIPQAPERPSVDQERPPGNPPDRARPFVDPREAHPLRGAVGQPRFASFSSSTLNDPSGPDEQPRGDTGPLGQDALERMGLAYGGELAKTIRDQVARLSACSLRWSWERDGETQITGEPSSPRHLRCTMKTIARATCSPTQSSWTLNSLPHLRRIRCRLQRRICCLSYSPMAMDVYAWLGYRLHSLERTTDVERCGRRWLRSSAQATRPFGNSVPTSFRPCQPLARPIRTPGLM